MKLILLILIQFLQIFANEDEYDLKFHSRRCNHAKKNYKKNYINLSSFDRKSNFEHYTDKKFEKIRIAFDYTYTLPYEEKMLKELVIPPVKNFFENALSVRRFPGRLRIPKNIKNCQEIPIPEHLNDHGVEADLVIIISTYKGMKKQYYINNPIYSNYTTKTGLNTYMENFFNLRNRNNTNLPPWEVNDGPSNVVGWSSMCLQDIYTLRPILGIMQYVADINPTPRAIEEAVWTTLHEIMHVLAMDFDLYEDFIDTNFNKLGYEGVIKIKSKLLGLEKLLLERKDAMYDHIAFVNFNGTVTTNNHTTINSNITDDNDDSYEKKGIFVKSTSQFKQERKNLRDNPINDIKSNMRFNNITNQSNSNNIDPFEIPAEGFDVNSIAAMLIGNFSNFYNSTNFTITNDTLIDNRNNFTLFNYSSILPELEFFYHMQGLKLEIGDDYKEVNFPKELNLTVLIATIPNFLEYTKIYIITPKVVEIAKKHFDCDKMDGLELEHFGGIGSAFSHWNKRILNTEFMIADSYGENYISNISLALLEDSGWYQVDYSKSEILPWGNKKGCDFLNIKCISQKKRKLLNKMTDIYVSKYNEFCTVFDEEKCSISHTFRGVCGIRRHEKIPKDFQYFEDSGLGGWTEFGDYCPIPTEWIDPVHLVPNGSCKNGVQIRKDLGEKICESCRCFISSLVDEKHFSSKMKKKEKLEDNRAACYDSRCSVIDGKLTLTIIVNEIEITCPHGGGLLSLDGYRGYVECPKPETVCSGILNPTADISHSNGYNLFSHLSEKLLNMLYNFIYSFFNKNS